MSAPVHPIQHFVNEIRPSRHMTGSGEGASEVCVQGLLDIHGEDAEAEGSCDLVEQHGSASCDVTGVSAERSSHRSTTQRPKRSGPREWRSHVHEQQPDRHHRRVSGTAASVRPPSEPQAWSETAGPRP